jgi:cell division protein FtsZ
VSDQTHSSRPPIAAPRLLVMGVGSSGARAVAAMNGLDSNLKTVVVDSDSKVLEGMAPEQTIHVGAGITRGLSAGGDVELGRQSIEKDSSSIRQRLRNVDVLIVVVGLGGGMGSGAVPVITRIACEAGILVLVLAALPFAFEGRKIARVAEEALKRIRTHADAIIRIPNERLLERADADIPVEQAFARSHQIMLDGILSLWRLLSRKGVCGLDFACIHTMLRNCDGYCNMAVAEASGADRPGQVIESLLKHPLLSKGKLLASAAGIIIGLTGGKDLAFGEIETVMNRLQEHLPAEDIWLNFGVVVEPGFEGRLSVMVLIAEQWKEPLVDDAGRQMGFRFHPGQAQEQGEFMLETVGKGEFSYVDPTIYNNQDLDVPAYLRRDIKLPR